MSLAREMYARFTANPAQDTLVHLPYFRQVAKGNILEIGVFDGASTSAFLLGLEENDLSGRVYSVDINPRCAGIFGRENPSRWAFINENSRNRDSVLFQIAPSPVFDVLFIDGDHSFEGCYADLDNYASLVRPGGLILVHDVRPETDQFPGVRLAFEQFAKETGWDSEVREGSWGLGVLHVPDTLAPLNQGERFTCF